MRNKEKEAGMMNNSSPEDTTRIKKIERGFKLPLRTWVEGVDLSRKTFNEETVLTYISHHGASFVLTAGVALGAKLRLIINLPPKLSSDKNLKLVLKGRVVFVEATDGEKSRQRVSLRLENRYIIEEEGPPPEESKLFEKKEDIRRQ
jgi:hypothetical protein